MTQRASELADVSKKHRPAKTSQEPSLLVLYSVALRLYIRQLKTRSSTI